MKEPPPRAAKSRPKKHASPASKATRAIPAWKDDQTLADNSDNRALYGELLDRYSDLPEAARHRLIRSEVSGQMLDLRIKDLVTRDGPRKQISGETAAWIESRIAKLGPNATPVDIMQIVMIAPDLPWSLRFPVVQTLAPYVHAKKAPAFELGSKTPAEIAMDIKTHLDAIDTSTQGES